MVLIIHLKFLKNNFEINDPVEISNQTKIFAMLVLAKKNEKKLSKGKHLLKILH
jgi:hypothetical protein